VLVTRTINDIGRQTTKGKQRRWFAVVGICCHGDGEWSFGVRWGGRGERTKLQLHDGSSALPSSLRIRFGPSLLHGGADDAALSSVSCLRVPVSAFFVVAAPLAPHHPSRAAPALGGRGVCVGILSDRMTDGGIDRNVTKISMFSNFIKSKRGPLSCDPQMSLS
jgi:hypothetical protein